MEILQQNLPVAPLAGAWIEIEMVDDFDVDIEGRSPRGSVD